jgi:hypothetical protein
MNDIVIEYQRGDDEVRTERYSQDVSWINLQSNFIHSIDLSSITTCTDLDTLGVDCNRLEEIDLGPVASCKKLKKLFLNQNELREIYAFTPCKLFRTREVKSPQE